MKNRITLLLVSLATIVFAQQIPAKKQTGITTIVGATAHIGNGEVIKNSVVLFKNGKLTIVADATTTKIAYQGNIIQAEGKHIYPGFISSNSTLGLVEIGAVKATKDERELGQINPHIRSIIAYNTESKITETARSNGILLAQITPRGGMISGTSSVVQLDAWNYEDAIIREDDGVHVNWPHSFSRSGWWANPGDLKENKHYIEKVDTITSFFSEAKGNNDSKNLKLKAVQGLFSGNKTLYIHANDEKEIIDAIAFKNKLDIKNMVLIGGFEAYKITDLLLENNIAVILKRVHSLPTTEGQDIHLPFKLPKILDDAGILVALDIAGGMERMQTRNLPFYAGTAIAFGLDYEKAVAMLSSNPAKILKINKQVGTLEQGKDATFVLSSGDIFDVRTNNIEKAFIQGREINLDTHQKKLFRKFSDKYEN